MHHLDVDSSPADGYGCIAFDIDGTLAARDTTGRYAPLDGVQDTLDALRERGTKIVFFSNNPIAAEDYAQRLGSIGLYTGKEEIVTPIDVLRDFVESAPGSAYAVGMDGRTKEYVSGFSDLVDGSANPDYVVVGWHPDFFKAGNEGERKAQYTSAAQKLAEGARLVTTSDEADVPVAGGSIPGTHSMLTDILDTCERLYGRDTRERAERGMINVGKPGELSYRHLEAIAGGERVLMVGDSLSTDILGAARNGIDAALTLTGNSARYREDPGALDGDLSSYGIKERPYVLENIGELVA